VTLPTSSTSPAARVTEGSPASSLAATATSSGTSTILPLVAGGLVVVRAFTTGHAPDVVDAALALVALVVAVAAGMPTWWGRVALPLLVGAAASVATSVDPWTSLLSLSLVLGVVAFVALPASVDASAGHGSARGSDSVLLGLLLGGLAHAVVAGWQRFVVWPDALARRDELGLPAGVVATLTSLRPLGLSLSPDLGAAVAVAGLAAALAIVVDSDRPRGARAGATVAAVVLVAAVAWSRSVGSALAVGIALVAVAIARRAWALLGGLGVVGVLIAGAVMARGAAGLLLSAGERWANWQVGWRAFVDAPLLGHGWLRFAAAYAERRPPDANVTRYAHSAPVQWLAETGLVGAVAVVVAFVVVAPRVVSALRGPSRPRAALAAGVVALAARAVVDYDLQVGQTAMLAATLVGLVMATAAPVAGALPAEQRGPTTTLARALVLGSALLLLVLVARATPVATKALVRLDLEVALRAAVATPEPAARRAVLAPFVERSPVAAVLSARTAVAQGDVDDAVALVQRALARDPGLPAALTLAVELARAGHGDVAAAQRAAARWGVAVPPLP